MALVLLKDGSFLIFIAFIARILREHQQSAIGRLESNIFGGKEDEQ